MTKHAFLKFLEERQAEANGFMPCFSKTYTNSDDYWSWHVPGVDGFQPAISLSTDGKVVLTYDLDSEDAINEEHTYEEFLGKFYITTKRGKGFVLS